MADPVTELAKVFLECEGYVVRKETKFHRNRVAEGTASDIDIVAIGQKGIAVDGVKLKESMVAEVKSWEFMENGRVDIYAIAFKALLAEVRDTASNP